MSVEPNQQLSVPNKVKTSARKKRHGHHNRHSHGKPMTMRTRIMRQVAAIIVLGLFFLLSATLESGVGYTDNFQLAFYLLGGTLVYYVTYKMYPTVHRAWEDSKK